MDESVRKMLEEKYGEKLSSLNSAQAFANLGDVIAGGRVGSQNDFYNAQKKEALDSTLGKYDRQNAVSLKINQAMSEDEFKRQQAKDALDFKMQQLLLQKQQNEANLELRKQNMLSQKEERLTRTKERSLKDQELSSTQAKQLGLAESGQLANKQYQEALAKGKASGEFDPTSYSDMLDTSEWAPQWMKSSAGKEAMSAQAAWVESYLRDASGAAIPPSERGAYSKDYFPRPGDTPEILKNKESLRAQKEKAALIGAGPGAKLFEKQEPQKPKAQGFLKVLDPKGNIRLIPANQLDAAINAGGKPL